jgi:protoporphyrinogen oxidase
MKIAIIGAGVIGLTSGHVISSEGHEVVIFEESSSIGGLVKTVKVAGQELEESYHHIFTSDTEVIQLAEELGLGSRMTWESPESAVYINNCLYPFSSPMDLLKFRELPFFQRAALGFLILRSRFIKTYDKLEKTSAKEWIIKNAGKETYDKYWGPLLNSKFDSDADRVAASWIWNKFKLRGATRGKNINKEMFGYMKNSFGEIYSRLEENIIRNGGRIRLSDKVTSIIPLGDTYQVISASGSYLFDKVLVTTAPKLLTDLVPALPEGPCKKAAAIRYKSNICVILRLTKKLSKYYWITIADKDYPFVAVIEHTNLMPAEIYGSNIVYLSRYLDESSDLFTESDENICSLFFRYLKKMFPELEESDILGYHVGRSRFSQPVVVKEYSNLLAGLEMPMPNLYLASMAQIYPEDRGQNYCIRLGKKTGKLVISESKDQKGDIEYAEV